MKYYFLLCVLLAGALLSVPAVQAFTGEGCSEGECRDCHDLGKDEAQGLLKDLAGRVLEVRFSEVPGLWVVDVEKKGKKFPVFIDFSKQYLIGGKIIKLATKEDVSLRTYINLNRVDVSRIPLGDAIVIGNPKAKYQVIVFDDPECTYCKKLHPEMKRVAKEHPDIAFFIKLYPLTKIHPQAYNKAKAIICAKSLQLLDDSLAGKPIPAPSLQVAPPSIDFWTTMRSIHSPSTGLER